MATAGRFPGIPVRNGRKGREDYLKGIPVQLRESCEQTSRRPETVHDLIKNVLTMNLVFCESQPLYEISVAFLMLVCPYGSNLATHVIDDMRVNTFL